MREEDLDEEDEEDLSRSRVQFKLAISVLCHVGRSILKFTGNIIDLNLRLSIYLSLKIELSKRVAEKMNLKCGEPSRRCRLASS